MSSRIPPLVIGVLGGIGSGKSALARGLSNTYRTLVLDADKVGHDVLMEPRIQAQLRQRFGSAIFSEDGSIQRQALAAKVFGSEPCQQQARRDLNAIVHPEIRSRLSQQINDADPDVEIIVIDAAVMLEAGWDGPCDALVFLEAPFNVRLERVRQRGWTEDDLICREASQLSLDEKRQRADCVIDNSGTLAASVRQLTEFLTELSNNRPAR